MAYQFYVPTRTMFGCGVLNDLHTQKMPGKKAMVVISNGQSMKRTGTLQCLLEQLEQADVEAVVFDRENAVTLLWLWAAAASWTLPIGRNGRTGETGEEPCVWCAEGGKHPGGSSYMGNPEYSTH